MQNLLARVAVASAWPPLLRHWLSRAALAMVLIAPVASQEITVEFARINSGGGFVQAWSYQVESALNNFSAGPAFHSHEYFDVVPVLWLPTPPQPSSVDESAWLVYE